MSRFWLVLLLLSGCTADVKRCKGNTLFLSVTLGGAAGADQLQISVAVAGGTPVLTTVAHTAGRASGGIEIDFPSGYPTGQSITVAVTALENGATLGANQITVSATPGCASASLAIDSSSNDLAGADLTGTPPADLSGVDFFGVDFAGSDLLQPSLMPDLFGFDGAKLALGDPCSNGTQCSSTFCVDGVCCNTGSCSGCNACNLGGGLCKAVPNGQDPHNACTPGPCALKCDGSGACAFKPASTKCSESCSDGGSAFIGQYYAQNDHVAFCTGTTAACPVASVINCPGGYMCQDANSCRTGCTNDSQCLLAEYCDGTSCVNRDFTTNACTRDPMCLYGHCSSTVGVGCGKQCLIPHDCYNPDNALCDATGTCVPCVVDGDCTNAGLGSTCTSGKCSCTTKNNCGNLRAPNCTGSGVCGCGTGTFCPYTGQQCSTTDATGICKPGPGFPCLDNTDCISGTCTAGLCSVNASGQPCRTATDCVNNCIIGMCF